MSSLLKVDVPDVRKSVDRARDALKTLTAVATIADAEKLLDAQDACKHAIGWIAMVEERCKGEQLHLNVKQEPREVDFVPFRPSSFSALRTVPAAKCPRTTRPTCCTTAISTSP
jgi:hypothetical protein